MTYRENGLKVLSTILNKEDSKIIENIIYKKVIQQDKTNQELKYNEYIYQIYSDFYHGKNKQDVLFLINNNKLGWDHVCFDEFKKYIDEQDNFIENPFQIEEGALECMCGSKRVFYYQKQMRSSDEGYTTIATCCKCNKKWMING